MTNIITSWRDHLVIHPAANLFPAMSEPELRELGEDIEKNGLRSPIILWSPGDQQDKDAKVYLLDGRNRLDAMEMVGISTISKGGKLRNSLGRDGSSHTGTGGPVVVHRHELAAFYPSPADIGKPEKLQRRPDTDPYALALSLNVHRRHLTAEQRRDLAENVVKARPEMSDRFIAKRTNVDHKTVGKIRAELESTGEIPQLKKTVGSDGKARTSPKKRIKSKSEPDARPSVAQVSFSWPAVSPRHVDIKDFTARVLELIQLTRGLELDRFVKTELSLNDINHLALFFTRLVKLKLVSRPSEAVG
jgi:hypothetical protein